MAGCECDSSLPINGRRCHIARLPRCQLHLVWTQVAVAAEKPQNDGQLNIFWSQNPWAIWRESQEWKGVSLSPMIPDLQGLLVVCLHWLDQAYHWQQIPCWLRVPDLLRLPVCSCWFAGLWSACPSWEPGKDIHHAYTLAGIQSNGIYTCIYTCIYTYIHVYIYTYTHIYHSLVCSYIPHSTLPQDPFFDFLPTPIQSPFYFF